MCTCLHVNRSVLHCSVQYRTVLHCTVLYSALLYCTVVCFTVLIQPYCQVLLDVRPSICFQLVCTEPCVYLLHVNRSVLYCTVPYCTRRVCVSTIGQSISLYIPYCQVIVHVRPCICFQLECTDLCVYLPPC